MTEKGLVHFYYGYGKGKTSAAVGSAVRAAGSGFRVLFIQFLKNTVSGETEILETLPGITVLRGIGTDKFTISMTEDEKESVRVIHNGFLKEALKAIESDDADMIVLDELGDAFELGLADRSLVFEIIEKAGGSKELIITGHNLIDEIADRADYVTEMRKIKHPFDRGISARKGIEF